MKTKRHISFFETWASVLETGDVLLEKVAEYNCF